MATEELLRQQFAGDNYSGMCPEGNEHAAILEKEIMDIPEVEITFPREANSVFVKMPEEVINAVKKKGWAFYTFIGAGGARLMCSWDTAEDTINAFVKDLKTSILEI